MTAKEKADELLKKFFSVDFEEGEAKAFANIVCDEVIIALHESLDDGNMIGFWLAVKSELE